MNFNKEGEIKQLKIQLSFLEYLKEKTDDKIVIDFLMSEIQTLQSKILLKI